MQRTSAIAVPTRPPVRPLTPAMRFAVSVAVAAAFHAVLLLFLELAVQAPWPQPHTYLGSVTVELEAIPRVFAPVASAEVPAARVEPQKAAPQPAPAARTQVTSVPRIEPTSPPVRPSTTTPATTPRAQQAQPASPAPTAPAASAAPSSEPVASGSDTAAQRSGAATGVSGTDAVAAQREETTPSTGAQRDAASVSSAPVGSQASDSPPAALVESTFMLPPRSTETPQASTGRPEETPLARVGGGGTSGTVGRVVGPTASGGIGPSLVDQVASSRTGSAGGAGTVGGGGGAAQGTAAALPLVDPGGRYEIKIQGDQKGDRGVLFDPQPDLTGLDGGGVRITVNVSFMIASSGFVVNPVVRGAPSTAIEGQIRKALLRWSFTPVASDSSAVSATMVFTIVPRS